MKRGIPQKLGQDFLKRALEKKKLWKSVQAGQASDQYRKAAERIAGFKGSKFISWNGRVLKLKAKSSVQKQEMFLKQEMLREELKKEGLEAADIQILF